MALGCGENTLDLSGVFGLPTSASLSEYDWECGTQSAGSGWSLVVSRGWVLRLWEPKACSFVDYYVEVEVRSPVPWVNHFALLSWRPHCLGSEPSFLLPGETGKPWGQWKMMHSHTHMRGKYGWLSCDTAQRNDLCKIKLWREGKGEREHDEALLAIWVICQNCGRPTRGNQILGPWEEGEEVSTEGKMESLWILYTFTNSPLIIIITNICWVPTVCLELNKVFYIYPSLWAFFRWEKITSLFLFIPNGYLVFPSIMSLGNRPQYYHQGCAFVILGLTYIESKRTDSAIDERIWAIFWSLGVLQALWIQMAFFSIALWAMSR